MNPALKNNYKHILGLALGALSHANRHACYYCQANRWWSTLSVLQAAHAAELIVKARIAQEHPLLIFEQIPKSAQSATEILEFSDLFERGRTVQYFDLPERLWAATGVKLPALDLYQNFGKLRNALQHFGPAKGEDLSGRTLEFVFGVIDPLINDCWGLFAVDYDEDDVAYEYMLPSIIGREILFRVPASVARVWHYEGIQSGLKQTSSKYRNEMNRRAKRAKPKKPSRFGSKQSRNYWESPWPWYGTYGTWGEDENSLVDCGGPDRTPIPLDREIATVCTAETLNPSEPVDVNIEDELGDPESKANPKTDNDEGSED